MNRWLILFTTWIHTWSLVSSTACFADDHYSDIEVVAEELEKYSQANGQGLYWDILREIYQPQGISLSLRVVPYPRAIYMVKQGKADAMLNAGVNVIPDVIYPKWHINTNIVTVIFKKSRFAAWHGEYSMSGKIVGQLTNHNLTNYLYAPVKVIEVYSRRSGYLMLKSDRIDFFVDHKNDLNEFLLKEEEFLEDWGFDSLEYRTEDLLHIKQHIVFSSSDKGRAMSERFDLGFEKIIGNGELRNLFRKWDVSHYPF